MSERDDRGLIYLVLNQMKLRDKEEEYYDVGLVGLAKGIKTFDESKGFQKSTYYVKCIKNEICKELYLERLKKREGRKYEISLNEYVDKETQEDELIDFIADENQNTEKDALLNIQKEDLKYCIELFLTKKQKKIINEYYFQELSIDEIAEENHISKQMVYVHIRAAYKRLRPKMLKIKRIREERERAESHERRKRQDKSIEELLGF